MSAGKVMAYTVIVRHPETDIATAVLAGEPVPDWAKSLVHDDDLVRGSDSSDGNEPAAPKSKAKDKDKGKPEKAEKAEKSDSSTGGGDAGEKPTEPPRAGRGSGGEAWTVYAKAVGIDVPAGASRDDVMALVDQHNQK